MRLHLSPRTTRNIARVLPFPIIWSLTGWSFTLVEYGATGSLNSDPDTAITLGLSIILFAGLAMASLGLLVGIVELVYLDKLFRDKRFLLKIVYKLLIYALIMLSMVFLFYPIAASIELGVSFFDSSVWDKFYNFLGSRTFFSTIFQLTVCLLVCLVYAAISEHMGPNVLWSFLSGRYHQPHEEVRIFMFLDMKSSTRIAENLGSQQYFLLLRSYYEDLGKSIIDYGGQVYQYIGDEIVISWNLYKGIEKNNCINCFFAMKNDLQKRAGYYRQTFGIVPAFKAGVHFGRVTVGEIGALKKEIAFTGDVLNATARVQGLCNKYQAELLVTGPLMSKMQPDDQYQITNLGEAHLKGREETLELFAVSTKSSEPKMIQR